MRAHKLIYGCTVKHSSEDYEDWIYDFDNRVPVREGDEFGVFVALEDARCRSSLVRMLARCCGREVRRIPGEVGGTRRCRACHLEFMRAKSVEACKGVKRPKKTDRAMPDLTDPTRLDRYLERLRGGS